MAIPKELFDKNFLREELELPYCCQDITILEKSRWSVVREGVFEYQGRTYQIWWSEGATEYQDEEPWEHDDPEPIEVVKKEVTRYEWVPVEQK